MGGKVVVVVVVFAIDLFPKSVTRKNKYTTHKNNNTIRNRVILPMQNKPGIHFFPMLYIIPYFYLQDELSHFTKGDKKDRDII
jgi:hypothetical protein